LGKAAYIKEVYKKPIVEISSFSFYYQLIVLFTGSLIGIAILYFLDLRWFFVVIIALFVFGIFGTILYKPLINGLSRFLSFVFKKPIEIPILPIKTSLTLILLSSINWLLWAFAFYLFLHAVDSTSIIHIKAGLLFPISSIVGIIVVFAPGGLGFREGFIALGLTAFGMTAKDAATISVLSRLWFLLGESLFFICARTLEFYNDYRLRSE